MTMRALGSTVVACLVFAFAAVAVQAGGGGGGGSGGDHSALINARKALADAQAEDPKVTEAKGKVIDADKQIAELKKKFEDSLAANTEYAAAKKDVDTSTQKLTTAKTALADAAKADAQRSRGSSSGGGGRGGG